MSQDYLPNLTDITIFYYTHYQLCTCTRDVGVAALPRDEVTGNPVALEILHWAKALNGAWKQMIST